MFVLVLAPIGVCFRNYRSNYNKHYEGHDADDQHGHSSVLPRRSRALIIQSAALIEWRFGLGL